MQTDLQEHQHVRFHIDMIPQEITDEHNLEEIVEPNGWCYAEIRKCMCGLPVEMCRRDGCRAEMLCGDGCGDASSVSLGASNLALA